PPAKESPGIRLGHGGEELRVDLLDGRDRPWGEPCSQSGDAQPTRARIGGVDLALEQALALEAAQYLRGHLDIGARLRRQPDLRWALALLVQPPGAGEQHELDMGEVERGQRVGDATLPAQRGV